MSNKAPTQNVYVVNKNEVTEKEYWTKVGVVFEHQDGKGGNIVLTPGIAVSGRLVVRDRKPADAEGDE